MTALLSELQKFSGAWATTEDGVSIMTCLSGSADTLGIYVYCAYQRTSYKREYDESDLYKVRSRMGENTSWPNFFLAVVDAIQSNRVVVRSSKFVEGSAAIDYAANSVGSHINGALASASAPPQAPQLTTLSGTEEEICVFFHNESNGRAIVFSVERTTENMQNFILEHLLQRQHMYAHPRELEQKLQKLTEEDATLKAQSEGLEREALSLKENLARNKQLQMNSNRRLTELRRQLSPEENETAENPWTAVLLNQEAVMHGSRMINPLRDRTCKEFDMTLLRLIKSYWIKPEECDPYAPANCVVQPFTVVELNKQMQSFVQYPVRETIWNMMGKLEEWDYDVFAIQRAMTGDTFASLASVPHGGALFVTMYGLWCKHKLLQKLNLNEQVALNWISMVEAGYRANPYHNLVHAADVLHITHFIMDKGGLMERCNFGEEHLFAALFAAAIHDFDHPGINNNFHVKTESYLAYLYNDRSVLENLHVSSVFELMKNPAYNLLGPLAEEQRRNIRELIVEMVLATDMGLHGKYLARLTSRLQERAPFTKREDQILALQMALKMADVSNCGRPTELYLPWSSKVSDEFYLQGDRERNLGLSCSPFMDRMQPAMAKGQIAFMNYIITPFFEKMAELLPNMRFVVELVEVNKEYWAAHEDK